MPQAAHRTAADFQQQAACAERRSLLYLLLARLWEKEPDAEAIRRLQQPVICQLIQQAGVSWDGQPLASDTPERMVEQLGQEYTRLFVASPEGRIALNESVYRDGQLWGSSTVAVKRFVRSLGLELDPRWTGLPDHISVELTAMQRLAEREGQAWQAADTGAAQRCLQLGQQFLSDHLLQWVPTVCEKVLRRHASPLYRMTAELTQRVLQNDQRLIRQLLADFSRGQRDAGAAKDK